MFGLGEFLDIRNYARLRYAASYAPAALRCLVGTCSAEPGIRHRGTVSNRCFVYCGSLVHAVRLHPGV